MGSDLFTSPDPPPGAYAGQILDGPYSDALKRRVADCIARYRAFEETGSPGIAYIAAWRENRPSIWYEYAGSRLATLLECSDGDLAAAFRRSISDRCSYAYLDPAAGIRKEIQSRDELSVAWESLREAGRLSGTIEAVYRLTAPGGKSVWLKDQARIETHREDGVCLSLGYLTVLSIEMEAEAALNRHRNRLEKVVRQHMVQITALGAQLRHQMSERRRVEEQLRKTAGHLRRNLHEVVHAVSLTMAERDPYTAGHQRRATALAVAIAREMGMGAEQIEGLRTAGLVHDIGKIAIPAEILSKPGQLNDAEMQLIRRHPEVAHEILRDIEFPWPVQQIVLQHHEKIDGSGYPSGLSGAAMLPEAKVLSVADVVETIVSHRPYRPSLGIEKALEEILRHRGTLYEGVVVDACLRLFREKGYQLEGTG